MRQRANMILMAMSEENRFQMALFSQITKVGNDNINAQHFSLREHQSTIDGNRYRLLAIIRTIFNEHQVETNFPQPTERNNTKNTVIHGEDRSDISAV